MDSQFNEVTSGTPLGYDPCDLLPNEDVTFEDLDLKVVDNLLGVDLKSDCGSSSIGFALSEAEALLWPNGTGSPHPDAVGSYLGQTSGARKKGTKETSDVSNTRDRRKKDVHNMIERRRRYNINDRIKELGTLLPDTWTTQMKLNKGTILRASVTYIRLIHKDSEKYRAIIDYHKCVQKEKRRIADRLSRLETLLNENGIGCFGSQSSSPSLVGATVKREPANVFPTEENRSTNASCNFPYQPQRINSDDNYERLVICDKQFIPCLGDVWNESFMAQFGL